MRISPNILESEPARPRTASGSDRERINALGRIYLEAGLPLAAAFEAALADFRTFETQELCMA